jgi:hypothetical protein
VFSRRSSAWLPMPRAAVRGIVPAPWPGRTATDLTLVVSGAAVFTITMARAPADRRFVAAAWPQPGAPVGSRTAWRRNGLADNG